MKSTKGGSLNEMCDLGKVNGAKAFDHYTICRNHIRYCPQNILISSQGQRKKPPRCEVRLPHHLPKCLLNVSTCTRCEQ
jgi:hypothetical protein